MSSDQKNNEQDSMDHSAPQDHFGKAIHLAPAAIKSRQMGVDVLSDQINEMSKLLVEAMARVFVDVERKE